MSRENRLTFSEAAADDIISLHNYIAENSGGRTAGRYVLRIQRACENLVYFPQRGSRREDLGPSLRTIGFERRATIVFSAGDDEVTIIRIFYGGQDFEAAFGDEPES